MRVRNFGGFKSGRMVGLAAAIIFSGGILSATENLVLKGGGQATTPTPVTPYYSPALAEVLSLLGAKVSPDVVKTFIKTSSASFDMGPQTIIGLRNMGVSDDIVNALLQRDSELKTQAATMTAQSYNYTPPPPPEMPPGYEAVPENTGYGYQDWGWWQWPWWGNNNGFGQARFDRFGRLNSFNRNPNRNVFLTSHQPSGVGGQPPPGIAGTPPGIGGQMPRGAIPAPRGGLTGGGGGVAGKSGGGGVGGAIGGGGHR
jgi:hypothetical protein